MRRMVSRPYQRITGASVGVRIKVGPPTGRTEVRPRNAIVTSIVGFKWIAKSPPVPKVRSREQLGYGYGRLVLCDEEKVGPERPVLHGLSGYRDRVVLSDTPLVSNGFPSLTRPMLPALARRFAEHGLRRLTLGVDGPLLLARKAGDVPWVEEGGIRVPEARRHWPPLNRCLANGSGCEVQALRLPHASVKRCSVEELPATTEYEVAIPPATRAAHRAPGPTQGCRRLEPLRCRPAAREGRAARVGRDTSGWRN